MMSSGVSALEAPPGQIHLDDHKILRGRFVQEHQMSGVDTPVQTSGRFVVAPAYGLIWDMEQPFPTSTIITPKGATQSIAGITMKLPAKNLRHLYDMVGRALAGDWNGLENDFVIVRSSKAHHWQMLLTPVQGDKPKLAYNVITVSGNRFVENIVMTKADGSYDSFDFTDESLSSEPMPDKEAAAFHQILP